MKKITINAKTMERGGEKMNLKSRIMNYFDEHGTEIAFAIASVNGGANTYPFLEK